MFKLSLKKKLIGMLVIFLGLLTAVGGIGLKSLKKVAKDYDYVVNNTLNKVEKIESMVATVQQMRGDLYKIGFNFDDVHDRSELIKKIEEGIAKYDKLDEQYNGLTMVDGEREIYSPVQEAWSQLKSEALDMLRLASPQKNDMDNYFPRALTLANYVDAYTKATAPWMELQLNEKTKWEEKVKSQANNSALVSTSIVVSCVIFGLFLGYFFSTTLSNQLANISDSVTKAGTELSATSSKLSSASEKLSSASQQQASAIEETSASLTEISGMAESNVHGAEHTDEMAKEVYAISEETRKSMDNLAITMSSILESNNRIEKLVKVIEEVGEKTEVIDDIVFKTQLLSFNASVEAERAGEHGRGFAVVAQEVGNLAQLSGKAALEISTIVKNSIKEAASVAAENKTRVTSGGKLANETKDKMSQVLHKMNDILENVSKIVQASREQGQGINQTSSSVESISRLTQETATTAVETADSSAGLSSQAAALMNLVSELKKLVDGKKPDAEELLSEVSLNQERLDSVPKAVLKSGLKSPQLKVVSDKEIQGAGHSGDRSDEWSKL